MTPGSGPEFGAWEFAAVRRASCEHPDGLPADAWHPAEPVPVAALPVPGGGEWTGEDLEESEFWYRSTLRATGPGVLRCEGLATIAEIWVDGVCRLRSSNMFVCHDLALPASEGGPRALHLCFRSTRSALRHPYARRARWRPRLPNSQGLRTLRSSFLGRMPGWCPSTPCVGPWRAITWLDATPSAPPVLLAAQLRPTLEGEDGRIDAELTFTCDLPEATDVRLVVDGHSAHLERLTGDRVGGTLLVASPRRWWPHTHGAPSLHEVSLHVGGTVMPLGRVGFRTVAADFGQDGRGFGLLVNGVSVFCRGACWTSAGLATMPWSDAAFRPWLQSARAAGMNMLRVGGTMAYEPEALFALCDELGILVWQDVMLANFDYPEHDPEFLRALGAEIDQLLLRTAAHPCLAVLCGGSETMQQAAMLGMPAEIWRQDLYRSTIPEMIRRRRTDLVADLVYVENSPCGGALPFGVDSGVAHYYGVGAYLRPLDDARRSDVRFASECLAFANVPSREALERHMPGVSLTAPRWKAAVPRDPGSSWDFEDVRDHYLQLLFGVDPASLRRVDPARYLDLSRASGCAVMERVFAEWRRSGSNCAGGLVWQFQDVAPGAGWGVLDSDGHPKPVWHALRRAFRSQQLVMTDEGLNGLALHVVNEHADPLDAVVRLVCLRDGEVPVRSATRPVSVPARSTRRLASQDLLAEFFDINHAYRFGPRAHDVVCASLWRDRDSAPSALLAYDHHVLADMPPVPDLGLQAVAATLDGRWEIRMTTRKFAQYCHFDLPGYSPDDDWFNLSPDIPRVVGLQQHSPTQQAPNGEVYALNLRGGIRIARES